MKELFYTVVDYLFFRDVSAIIKPMDTMRARLLRHSARQYNSAQKNEAKATKLHTVSALKLKESSRAVSVANKLQEFFEA